ncbi:MAG: hypothetical protein H6721_23860 [Sandaracinus sp.]|nr:hypothetical protein [Sandaracinus sp.]MCB9635173.1 hypothetical protein [Sandaracinus sp.]
MKRLLPLLLSLAFACGDDDGLTPPDGGFPLRDGAPEVPDAGRGDLEQPPGELACDPEAWPIEADPTEGAWDGALYVPGVGGRSDLAVTALVALPDDDDAVLVGGNFEAVGRTRTRNVALWTGEAWQTLGDGVDGDVTALAADAGGVYYAAIRDELTFGGRVLRYADGAWTSIGAPSAAVDAMALAPDGRLWIGGWFEQVDEATIPYLAVWDGSAWAAADVDAPDAGVSAIAHHGTTTCIGGDFENVGALASRNAACFTGGTWSARAFSYPYYQINALTFDDAGVLYAAGTFPIEDPEDYDYGGGVARWVDGAWRLVGDGVHSDPAGPGRVEGVGVVGNNLYVTGGFVAAGFRPDAIPTNDAARYDLEAGVWDDVRGGLGKIRGISLIGTNALALATTRSGLVYFGGLFTLAGDRAAFGVVAFDGVYWRPLAEVDDEAIGGVTGEVLSFASLGECGLYVGGRFTYAGDQRVNNVTRLVPGAGWERLGEGLPGAVRALAVGNDPIPDVAPAALPLRSGGFVYAGLDDESGTYRGLAVWDGLAWSPLGGGANGLAQTLAVDPATWHLYAGGHFTRVGPEDAALYAAHVARWDGVRWHPLGTGLDAAPRDLLIEGDDVIAVGDFATAGGIAVDGIARFDGLAWHPVGPSGFVGYPSSVVRHGEALVVGGDFDAADVTPIANVAWLSPEGWREVGNGLPGLFVQDVASVNGVLFAVGWFSTDRDGDARDQAVAWLDGDLETGVWRSLRGGVDDLAETVHALADGLYVGGPFASSGDDQPSAGLARFVFEGGTP